MLLLMDLIRRIFLDLIYGRVWAAFLQFLTFPLPPAAKVSPINVNRVIVMTMVICKNEFDLSQIS
jgi:hypothetical protein